MIKSISIKNYQSHKDTFIPLKDGLNVITGASDSGKSVILRAFRWVLYNRPLGDEIRNWDTKNDDSVCVEITTNENIIVGKERKKKKNIYYIIENGNKQIFEAVGQDVPEQIIKALGVTDINIQSQHDKYFLLDSGISAGEVAKRFNEMVGLDVIDKTFKNFNSNISAIKGEKEQSEKDIKTYTQKIKELSFIDIYLPQFEALQNKKKAIEQKQEKEIAIYSLVEKIKNIHVLQSKLRATISFEDKINQLINKQQEITLKTEKYNNIQALLINGFKIEDELSLFEILAGYEEKIKTLKEKIKGIELRKEEIGFIENKVHSLKNIQNLMLGLKEKIKENTSQLNKLLKQIKICPLCGTSLTQDKINHILAN